VCVFVVRYGCRSERSVDLRCCSLVIANKRDSESDALCTVLHIRIRRNATIPIQCCVTVARYATSNFFKNAETEEETFRERDGVSTDLHPSVIIPLFDEDDDEELNDTDDLVPDNFAEGTRDNDSA